MFLAACQAVHVALSASRTEKRSKGQAVALCHVTYAWKKASAERKKYLCTSHVLKGRYLDMPAKLVLKVDTCSMPCCSAARSAGYLRTKTMDSAAQAKGRVLVASASRAV